MNIIKKINVQKNEFLYDGSVNYYNYYRKLCGFIIKI